MRRQSSGNSFNDLNALLRSPQSRGLLFKIVGILAVFAGIWVVIVAVLSLFNAWIIVLLTAILGSVVGVREWHSRRREGWILQGRCAACGYDLRATPERCPECGRDATLDEPIWRRMRRELEAKLAKAALQAAALENAALENAALENAAVGDQPVSLAPTAARIAQSGVKLVARTPDFDEGPIPLEPAPGERSTTMEPES
jgi:hypothetical protein